MNPMDAYLRARDFAVHSALRQPGAPPVVGLVELDNPERVVAAVVRFVAGHVNRLDIAFGSYPYVTCWAVATIVRQSYSAEENYAVYKPIEKRFAIALPQNGPGQKALRNGFDSLCKRIGVTTAEYGRQVDIYLAQAGVPEGMLSHLAAAFLRQERHFGPVPTDNTEALNHWEDDALNLLPPGVRTPRRALALDETGWHADLFSRIRQAAGSDGSWFERAFREAIEIQEQTVSVGGGTVAVARPRLTWLEGSPGLNIPRIEGGRMKLWPDEASRTLRLRGGEAWPLPEPWPRKLRWETGAHADTIAFLEEPSALAFFERRLSGRFLGEWCPDGRSLALDGVDVVVLSRGLFSVDGEPCEARERDSNIAAVTLAAQPVRLETPQGDLILKSRPRRRITAHGGIVATGPRGTLQGPGTEFRLETGLRVSETRTLGIDAGACRGTLTVSFDTDGIAHIPIEDLLRAAEASTSGQLSDPCRLRLDLEAAGEATSTARSAVVGAFWIWPRMAASGDFVLNAPEPPTNLTRAFCRHITQSRSGQVHLDAQGGYENARLAFQIDGDVIGFDVPFPGETAVRVTANGRRQFLPRGAQVTLDEDDGFDTFTVRCPDPEADLLVRGRRERKPFRSGQPRHVSGIDLLRPAGDDRVILLGSDLEIELFRIVEPRAPRAFRVRRIGPTLRLLLEMSDPVEAVRLLIEDETGEHKAVESALGEAPTADAPRLVLVPDAAGPAGNQILLTIDPCELPSVLHLARILVREPERDGWRTLGNPRGDVFALAFEGGDGSGGDNPTGDAGLNRRFRTLSGWLAQSFAPESWSQVRDPVLERWQAVGEQLYETATGRSAVLAAAAIGPPEDAAASWVPIAHPLSFLPEMYGAPAVDFAACATAEDPAGAALAIVNEVGTGNLRNPGLLDHTALLGFANLLDAETVGAALEGFDPNRFLGVLAHPQIDADPAAGWFWRGRPLLGPAHWRAAHIRFAERLEAAELFTEEDADQQGLNGARQIRLLKLMSACGKDSDQHPPVPKRNVADDEPAVVDRLAAATLCAFSRAARNGRAAAWADGLGAQLESSRSDVLTDLAFLVRLAPELFAFYMSMWQLKYR